ncbi:MAG: hypothetical protein MMC33_007994 [Icmadophila ericetorum]|nr:hypothetical protein [Icmadophila ericetorum]
MDMTGHLDHGGMDMPSHRPMCNMNMLFTWDTTNLCIVFRWWHISNTFTLLLSLLGVALLTAGYEGVREVARRYEASSAEYANRLPRKSLSSSRFSLCQPSQDEWAKRCHSVDDDDEPSSPKWPFAGKLMKQSEQKTKTIKATLYAIQVFYSFFIMLLFMTYNGWIMLAVAVGAFIGYLTFGNASATKGVACH